jgi:hypothetical protein
MDEKMQAMNAMTFGTRGRPSDPASAETNPDQPLDAAWVVLEAANDLGDHATVEICRRVIDANLNGRPPSPYDLHIVTNYFR